MNNIPNGATLEDLVRWGEIEGNPVANDLLSGMEDLIGLARDNQKALEVGLQALRDYIDSEKSLSEEVKVELEGYISSIDGSMYII